MVRPRRATRHKRLPPEGALAGARPLFRELVDNIRLGPAPRAAALGAPRGRACGGPGQAPAETVEADVEAATWWPAYVPYRPS